MLPITLNSFNEVWFAFVYRILYTWRLKNCFISIPDLMREGVLYCIYKMDGRTVVHLLLHCEIATSTMCQAVFLLFGLKSGEAWTDLDLLACWKGRFGNDHNRILWRTVPILRGACSEKGTAEAPKTHNDNRGAQRFFLTHFTIGWLPIYVFLALVSRHSWPLYFL